MSSFDFPVRLPQELLEALAEFTGNPESYPWMLEPYICEAVRHYMKPGVANERGLGNSSNAEYPFGGEHPYGGDNSSAAENPYGGDHSSAGENRYGGVHQSGGEHPSGGEHRSGGGHPSGGGHLSESGYQWKEVFLPQGTRLRASFGHQPYFATVDGMEIRYGEQAISPSAFANLSGSGNRNAWKAIWLRFPGSDEWLLADVCRSARRAAIARLLGGRMPPDRQPSTGEPHLLPERATRSPVAGRSSRAARR